VVLYAVSLIRERKRLDMITRDLQEVRKRTRVAFDQLENSSFEFNLDQPSTLPSLGMPSDIGHSDKWGEIFKDPITALSRLFPEDYLEEKSKESFRILSEELCHFLAW
jgi:hypothetical protein